MQAVLFCSNSGLHSIPSSLFSLLPSTKSTIYSKEIADGAIHFPAQRGWIDGAIHFPAQRGSILPALSSVRSERNRDPYSQRKISSGRTEKAASELNDLPASDNEILRPSSQDEIMAVLRRILSSISRGGSTVSRRSPYKPKEKQQVESLLGTLLKYPRNKKTRVKAPIAGEDKESPQNSDTLNNKAFRDAKLLRPVSSFVKRTPISRPLTTMESASDEVEERLPKLDQTNFEELQNVHEMKLTELKELAKRKGIKGYSKLKKGELLELLEGLESSE